jgi:hypothetical protein
MNGLFRTSSIHCAAVWAITGTATRSGHQPDFERLHDQIATTCRDCYSSVPRIGSKLFDAATTPGSTIRVETYAARDPPIWHCGASSNRKAKSLCHSVAPVVLGVGSSRMHYHISI